MNTPQSSAERILAEATRLFAERGASGTSLQVVADAVGMRKASLLYHFSSKAALREAVVDALLSRWKDVVPRVLLAAASGKDRLDGVLGEVISFFEADPDRARLLVREILDRPDETRVRLHHHLRPWIPLVTDYIRRGQSEGRLHADADPEAWLSEMILLIAGHFAMDAVTDAVIEPDPDWSERRRVELMRIARVSLFRTRPKDS